MLDVRGSQILQHVAPIASAFSRNPRIFWESAPVACWRATCESLDMANFVRIALASNEEAKVRLRDGIHRRYFTEAECERAFELGNRCGAATMALLRSLL